jgi:hypothetical protein
MKRVIIALLIACAAVSGCVSPEATRTRGGGAGGDLGNRPETVRMHEGSDPYWNTPARIELQHAPLEPARQARRLSRQ